jgi:DNA-binding protein
VTKRVTLLVIANRAAGKLGYFQNILDGPEADLVKEEVATEATAVIAMTEEIPDADQGAQEEIAVRARQGKSIAERVVVTDVMRDHLTEEVVTEIAATTTDVITKSADVVRVAAQVETTRMTT